MKYASVRGFEGSYIVSDTGDVFSCDRICGYKLKGKTRRWKGRKLKQKTSKSGYMDVSLSLNGKVSTHRVHKLVAQAFLGERPTGKHIAHLDGNKANNSIRNLAFVTPEENAAHKVAHGTVPYGKRNGKYTKPWATPRGQKHGQSKLTKKQALNIRRSNDSSRKLAKMYNVSKTTILNIKSNKVWI